MDKHEHSFKKVLRDLHNDPKYRLKKEFGKLLMIQESDYTQEQKERYAQLRVLLKLDSNNLE